MRVFILFIFIVTVGSLVQAVIGFGSAVICMAFLPLLFPYSKALALNQTAALIGTLLLTIRYFRYIRWKVLIPLLIPTVIIGSICTVFSVSVSGTFLFILLGVVFIVLSVYYLLFAKRLRIKPTAKNGVAMGCLTGFSSGLFGIGGPPAALYLLPALQDKTEYMATFQCFFTMINVVALSIRIGMGSMAAADLPLVLTGWMATFLGTFLGTKIFAGIKSGGFEKLVYVFVGVNGLYIVLSHIFG